MSLLDQSFIWWAIEYPRWNSFPQSSQDHLLLLWRNLFWKFESQELRRISYKELLSLDLREIPASQPTEYIGKIHFLHRPIPEPWQIFLDQLCHRLNVFLKIYNFQRRLTWIQIMEYFQYSPPLPCTHFQITLSEFGHNLLVYRPVILQKNWIIENLCSKLLLC